MIDWDTKGTQYFSLAIRYARCIWYLAKLYDIESEKQHSKLASDKRSQIGTGDRSEKIRTYNFPQGRVTDHRINLSLYNIDDIMKGNINELLETIISEDNARKLANMEKN